MKRMHQRRMTGYGWMVLCPLLMLCPVSLRAEESPSPCMTTLLPHILHSWSMDGTTPDGRIPDTTGNAAGTLKNGASLAAGWLDQGAHLSAAGQYVSLGTAADLNFGKTAPFSVSMWVRTSTANGQLLAKGGGVGTLAAGYGLRLFQGKLQFVLVSKWNSASDFDYLLVSDTTVGRMSDHQWHQVTATYDGSSNISGMHLYVDGAPINTTADGNTTQTLVGDIQTALELRLGRRADTWGGYIGQLDELFIFNRTLSDAEVACLYTAQAAVCGDGRRGANEQCEDGNTTTGDGCGSACREEPGFACPRTPGPCVATTCTLVPAGLIHWWAMDEPGGIMATNRVGINNVAGVVQNGATFAPGYVQNALQLSAEKQQRVSLGNQIMDFGVGDPFSISLWVKTSVVTTASVAEMLVTKMGQPSARGYQVTWYKDRLMFFLDDTFPVHYIAIQESTPSPFNDGEWHQIVAVSDGIRNIAGLHLYVDGQLLPTEPFDVSHTTLPETAEIHTTAEVEIGDREWDNLHFFDGLLDEVLVFNRALTLAEVQAIYGARTEGVCKSDPTCNGTDDDGDGGIDDNYQPHSTECGVGACVSTGVASCVDGKELDSCTSLQGGPELCDGEDNNCDGQSDEGEICESDTTCDGVDNDGDGGIDDNYQPHATMCGAGPCAAAGTTACVEGNEVDYCVPIDASSVETCDEIDNNCDGKIDEGEICNRTAAPPPASGPGESTIQPAAPDPSPTPGQQPVPPSGPSLEGEEPGVQTTPAPAPAAAAASCALRIPRSILGKE